MSSVAIKSGTQIDPAPSANLQMGTFIINPADDKTYYISWEAIAELLGVDLATSGIQGVAITTTVPIATGFARYLVNTSGTFTNFKDAGNVALVVSAGDLSTGLVEFWGTNNVWQKHITPLALSNYYTKAESDAKFIIGPVNKISGKNMFNPATMVVAGKYIDTVNGSIATNASRSMTTPIPITPGQLYTITNYGTIHHGIPFRYTDSSGVYLSFTIDVLGTTDKTTFQFTPPAGAAFVEFTLITAKAGENTIVSGIQLEKGIGTSFEAYHELISGINSIPITTLEVLHTPPSNSAPISMGYATQNFAAITGTAVIGTNRFDKSKITPGFYINPASGAISADANYTISQKMGVVGGMPYTITGGSTHYGQYIRWVDDSDVMVGYGIGLALNTATGTVVAPLNATGAYMTVKTNPASGDNNDLNTFQFQEGPISTASEAVRYGIDTIGNSFVISSYAKGGQKYADSAINRADLDIRVPNYDMRGLLTFLFGDSITTEESNRYNWPVEVRPRTGIITQNFATSGAAFTDFSGATPNQKFSQQIANAIATGLTPELCIIALGTNDLQRIGTLLGDYDTAMGKAIGSLDRTLIYEAIRYGFYTLKNAFPAARIMVSLPLQRNDWDYEDMVPLLDAVRRMAWRYSIKVIEATIESGMFKENMVASGPYSTDGLHLNNNGVMLHGRYMAAQLKNYFFKGI